MRIPGDFYVRHSEPSSNDWERRKGLKRKYQVGTIYEGIIMAKHIVKQSASLSLQDKGGMDKINYRDLS